MREREKERANYRQRISSNLMKNPLILLRKINLINIDGLCHTLRHTYTSLPQLHTCTPHVQNTPIPPCLTLPPPSEGQQNRSSLMRLWRKSAAVQIPVAAAAGHSNFPLAGQQCPGRRVVAGEAVRGGGWGWLLN